MEVATPTTRKVLYVITKSNWGGAQRYVYDLALASRAAGNEVVVAAGGNGELITRLTEAKVAVYPIPGLVRDVSLGNEWVAFKALIALFRNEKPEVVHLNSSKAGIAALAARIAGVKRIVFTVHGWAWNEDRPAWQKPLIAFAYWATLLLTHTVIVVSHAAQEQARFLPFVQRKFRVIHNGVHPIEFLSRDAARRELLPNCERRFWVGTIAELHPVKGLPILIEAFEHFLSDEPDAELVIIGEGQERGALEQQMKVEGVYERTLLTGHLPNAARYLQAFDAFVLPSRSEGLAYVLLEAGQAGIAVAASNVGGIPEIIENGKTGLLVPYGDRAALTDALLALAREETLRAILGTHLKEKVESEFSLSHMTKETFALY